jgi:hypothetical protein
MERTTYTLWSKGRLLGYTELGYVRSLAFHRMGDLVTTDVGDRLLPLATAPARALRALVKASRDGLHEAGASCSGEELPQTTEYADAAEAFAQAESLELGLRAPDGAVIPTESVRVQDTHYLLELAREDEERFEREYFGDELDPRIAADIEHDAALIAEWFADEDLDLSDVSVGDEPWQVSQFPRYQIQIHLEDDRSVP